MIRLSGIARLAGGFVFLAWSASAQVVHRVWTVNAGQSLQSAIDAASDGDTVLVKASGDYDCLVRAKSLTVLADAGTDARIMSAVVRGLTASQRVELRGLHFFASPEPGLRLLNNEGLVWIEDCTVVDFHWWGTYLPAPGILVDNCADVVLVRTSSEGAGVQLEDQEFIGTNGHGLFLRSGSRVVAHGCEFRGADGYIGNTDWFDPAVDGAAGVFSESPGDRVFLSDCHAIGGDGVIYTGGFPGTSCSDGGPGIWSSGTTWVIDSQAEGGMGTSCSSDGLDLAGDVRLVPGNALRFSITAPVREGQSYQLELQGPPNTPTWLLFAASPTDRFRPQGPLLLQMPAVSFAGITDASGALNLVRSMPTMVPGLEFGRLFAQAFYLDPRGRFVLGGASMLLALDQSF